MSNIKTVPTSISAERVQYRVGHGGFHSTIVTTSGPSKQRSLVYVYDIGSKPKKALARDAIERFVARLKALNADRVDYLILSHVDEDHVNCLQHLMERLRAENISVDTVMLPWLNTAEKLMAKAHMNHRGPSTVAMNLAGDDHDTVSYLAALGAEEVAFVRAQNSPEPPQDPTTALTSAGITVHSRYVMSGTDLAASHKVPWKLVAMRLDPPRGVISEFTKRLRATTKLDPDDPATHPALLTQHRRKVSAAMAAAATAAGFTGYGQSLTNWSCIIIFGSSPMPAARHAKPVSTPGDFELDCDHGWLHTGDLPLHIPDVWQAFERMRNIHVSARLCALTAPHHGSPNGHNILLYTKGTSPLAALFTTGLSSKSTPGKIIYSHRNAPEPTMRDAALTTTVIELNNP